VFASIYVDSIPDGLSANEAVLGRTLPRGLPASLMSLAVFLAAIYLARILLKPAGATMRDWLLGLLVGLLVHTIVGFIPYLGGLVRLGVVCLGLGAFAWQLIGPHDR